MYQEFQVRVLPKHATQTEELYNIAAKQAGVSKSRIQRVDIVKRSIDARHAPVMLNLTIAVHIDNITTPEPQFLAEYKDVSNSPSAVVVGAGPAGLFAALTLIEKGIKPIVLERGKCVEDRKKDLAQLYKTGTVNPDSNFGFGEGGAGTFSDGKLFTRSKKRGNVRRTLEILVYHGAPDNILTDAHPHIGTDKLPHVISNMRKAIEKYGGEVHFNCKMEALQIHNNRVCGVVAAGKEFKTNSVILATGHSARDVYRMLHASGIYIEPKEFAVGMRLEHPQHEIDVMQYHTADGRGLYLPAAEYSFVTNICNRGVYSFCMCPGGVVVPAATGAEQQVVNGMSSSARNTPWANSAMVTSVGKEELEFMNHSGLFAGMEFQEKLEKLAYEKAGGKLYAPAQRLVDFIKRRESRNFPKTSYKPGITSSDIHNWFPEPLNNRLREGLTQFGRKAKGFMSENAVLLGVETRTSSPIRIPRHAETLQHNEILGLYPCGEGAGFAGGIISAAMDGEACALKLAENEKKLCK